MLLVFLLPLSTICPSILSLYGKASEKREDVQGVHEGITTRLSMLLFSPRSLTSSMQRCHSLCPWLFCYSMCPAMLLVQDMAASSPDSTVYSSVILAVCGGRRQYHSVFVLFFFPLHCALSLLHLSFIFLSPSFLPPPLFPLSCQLFIRCVNNCLPTVVIAPPCQPEVWSKCQCAQFSLAYIVQFLFSHVPIAKKKKSSLPLQLCFICGINFWDR